MSLEQLNADCLAKVNALKQNGVQKGAEKVIDSVIVPDWVKKSRLPDADEDKAIGVFKKLLGLP